MFHYFHGTLQAFGEKKLLSNELLWIEVQYGGVQKAGSFFLFPHLDDTRKTIQYFAFDTMEQKSMFESMLKVSGIGPKTAFHIAQLPGTKIQAAIKELDVKFFQSIPGIGPKTAKKLLLELKDSFQLEDLGKMDLDEKLFKNIVASLKNFGYEAKQIKEVLHTYEGKISAENLGEVVKWLITRL